METDGSDVVLDDDGRDEVLADLLVAYPDAVVSAVDAFGRLVPVPSSLHFGEQHLLNAGSPFQLVKGSARVGMLRLWDRAMAFGAASMPVVLVNGVDAVCHVVDVRHRHGVLVGMMTADAHVELLVELLERPAVVPRTGRVDKDETSVIRFADEQICQILGYTHDQLIGLRSIDLLHPDDHVRALDAWIDMLGTPGGTTRLRARHRRSDGSWLWMELTNVNRLEHEEGYVVTEMVDISDEMDALEALRQREQLLGRLAEALPSGVLHVDADGNVVYTNARLQQVVGVGPADTVDEQLSTVVTDDRPALERALRSVLDDAVDTDLEVRLQMPETGRFHLCAVAIRALTDAAGKPDGAVLCIDDVTEAAELRAELERRAMVDELTGCLNRATVLAELERVLRRHAAGSPGTAVVFLDLDGFKGVNDTYGHRAGDELLASVVARLGGILRSEDVIGRLGGDEFIVVLPFVDGMEEAMHVGRRLAASLAEPLELVGGRPTRIRASIGVAWASAADVTPAALTSSADLAMYRSKRIGMSEPVGVFV